MSILQHKELGNIQYDLVKEARQQTKDRWNKLGFLTGLEGAESDTIAQLFENQAKSLVREATNADSSGSFETVVFPIVRRVFSKLLANDIVSVQAMNMPIGKLFYFIPKTSSRVNASGVGGDVHVDPQYSAHTSTAAEQAAKCISDTCSLTVYEKKNLYDIYYNDGLFDNSKGVATINTLVSSPGSLDADGEFVGGSTFAAGQDGTVRAAVFQLTGFSSTSKGRMTGPTGNEMDTEEFLASLKLVNNTGSAISGPNAEVVIAAGAEAPIRLVTQKYGKGIVEYGQICDAAGSLYVEVDLQATTDAVTYDGYIGVSGFTASTSTFTASYASYSDLEFEAEMGEVTFDLQEVVVTATSRKLRATWSPEMAQDVSAFHNIDAEAELTAMLSEQVAAEIDREILRDLRKAGAWTLRWDYNGWRKAGNPSAAYTQKDWNQTLITKINQISAQIHKSTLRGGANYIVVSSEISAVLNDLEYFHVTDASADKDVYNMGIEKVGSLQGRYKVYCDPYSPANSMIIGHKGSSILDSGYIYAPYIPLQLTPTMYNPDNFAPVKGIMTRYAKKVVNNRFYGTIKVDGLQVFNANELR
jgi:hypothetical protein